MLSESLIIEMQKDIDKCKQAERNGSSKLFHSLIAKYSVIFPDIKENLSTGGKIGTVGLEFDYRPELNNLSEKLNMLILNSTLFDNSVENNYKEYDVFISHANSDKARYVENLVDAIKKLGISIFYDKNVLSWGDNWKKKIIDGVEKSEFAIIVISDNYFGREWTEKELYGFLNRQTVSGQKIILPLLLDVDINDLREKYPMLTDIQFLVSNDYSYDEIALQLAKQLIIRYK